MACYQSNVGVTMIRRIKLVWSNMLNLAGLSLTLLDSDNPVDGFHTIYDA